MRADNQYIVTDSTFNYKENCFDVLRLIAISIVILSHSFRHFGIEKPPFLLFLTDGSIGVMMFFAMSGFLIMGSYDRASQRGVSYWEFIWNRILRLYPAIICSFVFVIFYQCFYQNMRLVSIQFVKFLIGYLFLGWWGALWVIPVEIMFYLFTPLIYNTFKKCRGGGILFILLFWQFNLWDKQLIHILQTIPVIGKYIGVSFFLCFFYEFFIGCFLYFNPKIIELIIEKKLWILFWGLFLVWYIVYSYTGWIPSFGEMHNAINGFIVPFLTIFTGFLFNKRLKLDISYGLFIYHYVVITYLLANNFHGILGIVLTFIITPVLAYLSAITVEKIALNHKK